MKFLSVDNKSYDKILNVNVRAPFFASQVVAKKMKSKNIEVDINIDSGKECATVWTCDLTKEYIKINADYRS